MLRMATFDDGDKERVRAAVNILDVISPYVALKRSGPVFKGLCPFHSEKTPSFQVNPAKGFWHCFGCSEGGDEFSFIQKIENLSFREALERLAQIGGVTLTGSRDSAESSSKRELLYRALESATAYYQETLAQSAPAKEYLRARGVAHESIASFRLGYAGESFDGLSAHLRRQNISLEIATEAGVLTRSDRQYASAYDKLRGRIVCPILDVHDRPIAFGGRLMQDEKDRAKYLNTAETPLFSKGRTFYAMSRARKAMSDLGCAVVVEGYFDVISAHQAGFMNVVATLGTALTPEHADVLSRHVARVLLAFDADAAGFKAAQRANSIFEAKGFEVLVLDLPKGEDPDSLVRAGRIAQFRAAIDGAVPIREFQLRGLVDQYQHRTELSEREKVAIFRREITPLLRSTSSVIERERYIRLTAPLHPFYGQGEAIAEQQIRQEIGGAPPPRPADNRSGWTKRREKPIEPAPPAPRRSGIQVAEENLLRALLGDDPTLSKMITDSCVGEDDFLSQPHRELARRLLVSGAMDAARRVHAMTQDEPARQDGEESRPDDAARLATRLLATASDSSQDAAGASAPPLSPEVVKDSIARLRREQQSQTERQLRSRVDQGDPAAAQELIRLVRKVHGDHGGAAGIQGVQ